MNARFQLGAVLAAQGQVEQAVKELEMVEEMAPDFQDAHVQLATLYYHLNRKADGERERALVIESNAKERRQRKEQHAPPATLTP